MGARRPVCAQWTTSYSEVSAADQTISPTLFCLFLLLSVKTQCAMEWMVLTLFCDSFLRLSLTKGARRGRHRQRLLQLLSRHSRR